MKANIDRVPPQDIDAERAILGAILLNEDAVAEAIEVFGQGAPDPFYAEAHSIIYKAFKSLYIRSKPIDAVSVKAKLRELGKLDDVGGIAYLGDLSSAVPTAANVGHYCAIVLEKHMRRTAIQVASSLSEDAYEEDKPLADILSAAEGKIFNLAQSGIQHEMIELAELVKPGLKRMREQSAAEGRGVSGVASGFGDLDAILGGFQASDMVVVAARPSVGKTSFALNVAKNVAKTERRVLFFSLEMNREQIFDRMISMMSGIDIFKRRFGFLSDADCQRAEQYEEAMSSLPITIDDSSNIQMLELRSKARRAASVEEIGLVVIDYLQLMSSKKRKESRQIEVSDLSRECKQLARELKCPVLVLSQLSRAAESDSGTGPKLSHLRESGAIEQDADTVIMLHRPETEVRDMSTIQIRVEKQRNGPIGRCELLFEPKTQRFLDVVKPGKPGDPQEELL